MPQLAPSKIQRKSKADPIKVEALGSNDAEGTHVANMVAFARKIGLHIDEHENWTVEELKEALDAKRAVVMMQAWGYLEDYPTDDSETCPRDESGHCKPKDEGDESDQNGKQGPSVEIQGKVVKTGTPVPPGRAGSPGCSQQPNRRAASPGRQAAGQ